MLVLGYPTLELFHDGYVDKELRVVLIETVTVVSSDGDLPGSQDGAGAGVGQSNENEEVMRALLIHEKRSVASGGALAASTAARGLAVATANASDSESDTSESDDELPSNLPPAQKKHDEDEDEDDDFEEVGDEPTVMVGGRPFLYREVSQKPELVEQMSAQEKEAYIEMGQNLYQDMYYWCQTRHQTAADCFGGHAHKTENKYS